MKVEPAVFLVSLVLGGCAAPEVFPGGREYVVRSDVDYFRNGPAQPGQPEKLPRGTFLQVLSKEPAYSLVRLADGRSGYIATDHISPAPPTAPAVPFDPPEVFETVEPSLPDFRDVPAEIPKA